MDVRSNANLSGLRVHQDLRISSGFPVIQEQTVS